MVSLKSHIALAVPSTDNINQPADTGEYLARVKRDFCNWFGATTVSKSEGAYVAASGQVVNEIVMWVWSFCSTKQLEAHTSQVISLAEQICQDLHQESVAVIINNILFLVTAPKSV